MGLFAVKPVTVKSGNASVLKQSSIALLEIDFSATKVGAQTIDEYLQRRGSDFVRDWPQDQATAAHYFSKQFNRRNSKGMRVDTDVTETAYKMVIRVKSLDMGNPAGFLFSPSSKTGGVIIKGIVDIIDMRTNEIVCVLDINRVQGEGTFAESIRLALAFQELANWMCRVK